MLSIASFYVSPAFFDVIILLPPLSAVSTFPSMTWAARGYYYHVYIMAKVSIFRLTTGTIPRSSLYSALPGCWDLLFSPSNLNWCSSFRLQNHIYLSCHNAIFIWVVSSFQLHIGVHSRVHTITMVRLVFKQRCSDVSVINSTDLGNFRNIGVKSVWFFLNHLFSLYCMLNHDECIFFLNFTRLYY